MNIHLQMSLWRGPVKRRISMPEIANLIASTYGVSVANLVGPARHKAISHARQHAMWLMHQQPHLSMPQIGKFLGGRDHTTILHGIRRYEQRMAEGTAYTLELV
ncbi:MAG: hypothetical protein LCH78_18025 [Proteobacteria bacterium]|nr:hypothetical protein [Pseudomonadota bacterium]